jgi:hypothetical protein
VHGTNTFSHEETTSSSRSGILRLRSMILRFATNFYVFIEYLHMFFLKHKYLHMFFVHMRLDHGTTRPEANKSAQLFTPGPPT